MSVAQRVERPGVRPGETASAALARIAVPVDLREITRRAAASAVAAAVAPAQPALPAGPAPAGRGETDLALDLLTEVSRALPSLMERCQNLDAELQAAREAAKAEIEMASDVAREWQQIASALKLQVEGLEGGMQAMRQRAEAAEARVEDMKQDLARSQHAAAEAECLSSLFQEKVISSFGAKSAMHPILERFRLSGDA